MNQRVLIGFTMLFVLLMAVCVAMYGLSVATVAGSAMRIFGGVVIAGLCGLCYTLISYHIDEPEWL